MPPDAGSAGLIAAALGVGAVHALDADHIMAVSTLAARRPSPGECLRIAGAWSLGHAATLLAIGSLPFLLGEALPAGFAVYAERVVALLLAAIGLVVLRDLLVRGAHLRLHRHASVRPHVHWVMAGDTHDTDADANHGALLIGGLHGLAGSAPILALVPAGARGAVGEAVFVLLAFSIGVLAVMLTFGLFLGRAVGQSRRLMWIRGVAGTGSIALGTAIFCGSF